MKEVYVGQIYDPTGLLPKKSKYYLLFLYVEHDDKLQIFLLKFSSNPDNFSLTQLPDIEIWASQDISKTSYTYSFESSNQIYQLLMT